MEDFTIHISNALFKDLDPFQTTRTDTLDGSCQFTTVSCGAAKARIDDSIGKTISVKRERLLFTRSI